MCAECGHECAGEQIGTIFLAHLGCMCVLLFVMMFGQSFSACSGTSGSHVGCMWSGDMT